MTLTVWWPFSNTDNRAIFKNPARSGFDLSASEDEAASFRHRSEETSCAVGSLTGKLEIRAVGQPFGVPRGNDHEVVPDAVRNEVSYHVGRSLRVALLG